MTCEELNAILVKVKDEGLICLDLSDIRKLLVCSMKSHNIGCKCGKELDWENV